MSTSSMSSPSVSPVPQVSDSSNLNNSKRKAVTEDDEPTISKRAAKRKKSKKGKSGDDEIDEERRINLAISKMNNGLMADFIARQTKRFGPDLSVVELEDRRIPEHAFLDTSGWSGGRDLESLAGFLEYSSGQSKEALREASNTNGSPHTIIIASAGLRAADLTRSLRVYQTKSAAVAKLFAKHIKLKDAVAYTKNTRMNIAIGTPRRLLDLIEQGALSLAHVERLLIDASHIDAKKRGILNMEDTQVPLIQLLTRTDVASRYGSSQTQTGPSIKLIIY